MDIIDEEEKTIVCMNLDLTDNEIEIFLNYAERNMSKQTMKDLKIEWAFNELLRLGLNALEEDK